MIMRSIAWRIVSFIAYIVSYQLAVDSSCGAAGIVENLQFNLRRTHTMQNGHDIAVLNAFARWRRLYFSLPTE